MRIAPHFSLDELTKTSTGFKNDPNEAQMNNLKRLALYVLEPIRDLCGCPLIIHSGYRSYSVNRAVGGAWNSAHLNGRAADFHPGSQEPIRLLFERIIKSDIIYDKIILEYKAGQNWIHVQIAPDGELPRRLAYYAIIDGHHTEYKEVPR